MNILVDGRVFCRYASGITTFLQCSISEWSKQKPSDTFYLVLPKPLDNKIDKNSFLPNVHILEYNNLISRHLPNIVILQFLVPILCRRLDAQLYFSPVPHIPLMIPQTTTKVIAAHDVVNIEYKSTMSIANRIANTFFFGYSIKNADILWFNSQYTKTKINQYFPLKKCKRDIVGCSCNDKIYNVDNYDSSILISLKHRYEIEDEYVLFVGSIEPRKNISFLLTIAPQLYSNYGLQLVIVGANKWKNSKISAIVNCKKFLKEAVVFCDYVSDKELAVLYHGAKCFVSASLNEGFGLPQLEALRCGCPIVTANNSAMAEVANGKDGAFCVDGYDRDKWIAIISQVTKKRPTVNQEQLMEYDWNLIINRLLDII